ncbi:uncharacterized protein (DUF1015 family) [Ereboglobus sp. PH5-10]|uniref:DUF1015 domain-containing protein n=1 Tax=Ereboglobus sp. PH5-10 TaxID=2940629 RepID=UPI0024075EB9|nr:DUF1015 family protein [Ereboglobus sp. PH5-10]MDF9826416.1 uncharacterized protein (DUF1015 family) [Ereboglobus sp. PH5-10]
MRIRAFKGLVPKPELVAEVACVPYDVVNTTEAAALAAGKPLSLLHVDRAEIAFPAGTDIYSDQVYAKALEMFQKLQGEGALVRETEPCIYVYQQQMGEHVQRGIVALTNVEDYDAELIKKHEKTRKDKEDDRTRLIDTISANTGPVFLTYRDAPAVTALVNAKTAEKPLHDFAAPDGIRHTFWRVAGGAEWIAAFGAVPVTYIADGHHRAASAARVARLRRSRNAQHNGAEDYNWFLAVLFPASELKILPYNRIVADLNGHTPEAFLASVKNIFGLEENANPSPDAVGRVSMYLGGKWYGLRCTADANAGPVGRLDVSVLQNKLLAPLLGIDDPRTSKRIDFVGGIRGTDELVKRVDADGGVAFSMYPTTVEQLMDIADAGEIMPPKSTWFEPKLRSGLAIHTF